MIICGKNSVAEALASDKSIEKLFVLKGHLDNSIQRILDGARENNVKILFVTKDKLNELTTDKHQNVVAEISDFGYSEVSDILALAKSKNEPVFILILDGIEDPHNLGSIIRTAEVAGVHGIIIPKNRAVGVNDTVIRTSSGAIHHMKIAKVTNINNTIRELKDNFVNIVGTDGKGEAMYNSHLTGDIAVIIGSEGNGIKPSTLNLCDNVIAIPMYGKVNSLNASVACGIIVYEVVRQKTK